MKLGKGRNVRGEICPNLHVLDHTKLPFASSSHDVHFSKHHDDIRSHQHTPLSREEATFTVSGNVRQKLHRLRNPGDSEACDKVLLGFICVERWTTTCGKKCKKPLRTTEEQ